MHTHTHTFGQACQCNGVQLLPPSLFCRATGLAEEGRRHRGLSERLAHLLDSGRPDEQEDYWWVVRGVQKEEYVYTCVQCGGGVRVDGCRLRCWHQHRGLSERLAHLLHSGRPDEQEYYW